jgi:hypothetical protein
MLGNPITLLLTGGPVMAYSVSKVDIWSGDIDDRVGGLAAKLDPLADAGADLSVVIARRQPNAPGKGVVFLGPVAGAKVQKAATATGLRKAEFLASLRVEGPNKPGESRRIARCLADAGLNLRGLSAAALGKKFVAFLAFDSAADADAAAKVLRATGGRK